MLLEDFTNGRLREFINEHADDIHYGSHVE
jgi:hypothetical protein